MIRYRIQATIEAVRLPELVSLIYKDELKFDPELKIYPAGGTLLAVPPPIERQASPRRKNSVPGLRAEVVERELKTGPKRWGQLRKKITEAGLPEGSLNSLITGWSRAGKIRRTDEGLWSLVEHAA